MKNPQFKYLLALLALTFFISAGLFIYLTQFNEAKIFGCTEYDVYDGPEEHTKLPPTDIQCNLRTMNLAFGKQNDDIAGLVEYDLNAIGYLTMFGIFIFFPFILAYLIMLGIMKILEKTLTPLKSTQG